MRFIVRVGEFQEGAVLDPSDQRRRLDGCGPRSTNRHGTCAVHRYGMGIPDGQGIPGRCDVEEDHVSGIRQVAVVAHDGLQGDQLTNGRGLRAHRECLEVQIRCRTHYNGPRGLVVHLITFRHFIVGIDDGAEHVQADDTRGERNGDAHRVRAARDQARQIRHRSQLVVVRHHLQGEGAAEVAVADVLIGHIQCHRLVHIGVQQAGVDVLRKHPQVRQVGDHHIARQHVVAFVALGIGIVRVHSEGEMVGAYAAEEEAAGKGDAHTAIAPCLGRINKYIAK